MQVPDGFPVLPPEGSNIWGLQQTLTSGWTLYDAQGWKLLIAHARASQESIEAAQGWLILGFVAIAGLALLFLVFAVYVLMHLSALRRSVESAARKG